MKKAFDTFLFLYDLLFPRDAWLISCDTVSAEQLEKRALRVFANLPFSCIAPLAYKDELVRNLIHAAKFHGHEYAANVLGEVLSRTLSEELAEKQMFSNFTEPLFTFIPLYPLREKERGYNQAERITWSTVEHLGYQKDVLQNVLVRVKNTPPQTHVKNKSQRMKNLKNAFQVHNKNLVKGKDVVLIDDVVTTGATLESAKHTLLQAGARDVLCVATAH